MKYFTKSLLRVSCIFIVTLISSYGYGQTVVSDSIMNGVNFEKAALAVWFKNDVKKIRGIILVTPGSNGDGRKVVYDTAWQNLAAKHDFALAGSCFKDKHHDNMDIEQYADVAQGSGQAVLDILKSLSKQTKHAELENAPLVLFGVSAGGQFDFEFTCWKPERVIAFVVNKGGIYYHSLAPPATWEIPGVFITGEKDSPFRNNIVKGIFSINRRFGAKWMFAEETGVAHEFANSIVFARSYFDQIIPLRLGVDSRNGNYKIGKLTMNGFLGINSSRQIVANTGEKQTGLTSWFPSQQLAEVWLEFTK